MDTLDGQIKEWTETQIRKSCLELAERGQVGEFLWRDCSSHSRSDKEKIPYAFQAVKETPVGAVGATGRITITIVYNHIRNPGKWLVRCPELGIDEKQLKSSTAQAAAAEAVDICREKALLIATFFIPQKVFQGIEVIKQMLKSD